jgi:type III secretory pathway lipoprotein EscJ
MSKKLLSLLVVLVVIAGCNKEKIYKDNLKHDKSNSTSKM